MRVISCLTTMHDLWLVALAAIVCVGGGYVAFELLTRGRDRDGLQRSGWFLLAAIACGTSVWCTHFISMLAYDVSAPVTYDPILTMASLLIMICGAVAAFRYGMSGSKIAAGFGGGLLGLSISAMHYTGMLAYHVDGVVEWDIAYLLASVVLAVAFGVATLLLFGAARRVLALASFVTAVVTLHFTGMTAVAVTPLVTGAVLADASVTAAMAVAIAAGALIIVGTGITSYMIDTAATEKSLSSLRMMAMNDALTGMPNRTSFGEYLAAEIHRAETDGRQIAIVGVDLDRFKEINDIHGHKTGDEALKVLSQRMMAMLRGNEFVARIGGDEFAAIKPFTDTRDLNDFLARLEGELCSPMHIHGFELVVGASLGVAVYPQDGDTASRLSANADLAMYRAKDDVARTVCFYEAEMDELARERRELAIDLKKAINLQQLELFYQLKSNVTDLTVAGYEVLLRWKHPARGYVSPADFIPLAEETGSILAIGEWVLREACRQAASWEKSTNIAVNLSAVQLTHCDLARIVHTILLETGLPASRLELEITETTIIQDKVRSLQTLRRIRALGVTIALDDFGTGYSSLDTLRSFPFDRIKLDKSFMDGLEHNVQSRAIIRAVVALGRSLDISVLAEGVETREQLRLLAEEGCNEVQGYLLGRPAPQLTEPTIEPDGLEARVA